MIKLLVIPMGVVLIAGTLAAVDRPFDGQPSAAPSTTTSLPGQIFATGIVEGRTESVELRPHGSGQVDEVLVRLGEWVEPGQVLIRLDARTQRAQVAVSLAKLQLAQANLDRLINGARDTERQEARAMLAAKQARLHQAQLTWQRIQTLRSQEAIAQQDADDQEGIVATLAAEVDAAAARLAQLEAAAREDELRAAQAHVAAAAADYELATIALDRTELRAPLRGQVVDLQIEPGELASAEGTKPVVVLVDASQLRVRAFVEEIDAPRIAVGARAEVSADGLPGRSFSGVVCSVSPRMKAKTIATDRPDELYDSKFREVLLDLGTSMPADGPIVGLRVDVVVDASAQPSTGL